MNVIETRLQSLAWDAVKAEPAYGLVGSSQRRYHFCSQPGAALLSVVCS
jgi:hypothetical protein